MRVFAQALTTNFASEFTLEDYNLSDAIPVWREALVGTIPEKIVKLADPVRRAEMKEIHEARGGLFASGYVLADIKVHWVSSDAPDAARLKDEYEGYTIGEIAARDVAVAGDLKVGFATPLLETPPESMAEVANSSMALPGVSDGGAHTKFVTTGRYPTELLGHWVRDFEIMSLEQAHWRLSAYPAMAAGLKDRGHIAEGLPADIIIYDPATVDSDPAERLWDYPAGEWRLVQKARGYHHIMVNGTVTFNDNNPSNFFYTRRIGRAPRRCRERRSAPGSGGAGPYWPEAR